MQIKFNHNWDLTPIEAVRLQKELASQVQITIPFKQNIRYIAGIDCAPSKDKNFYFAAAVIWDLEQQKLIEYHIARVELNFPYIPGLLSFREIPAILEVIKKIHQEPDIIMVDGHGIAHPRHFGIACHLGVILDYPTFGCGKSLLFGNYQEPGLLRGAITPLLTKTKSNIIGQVIRTKSKVKPVIVSIGHKIDLATATNLVLECSNKYRLPEPIRLADKFVAEKKEKSFFILENLM